MAGASFVLILLCGGLTLQAVFFMKFLILGFVLGELFERNFSIEKTALCACGAILGLAAFGGYFFAASTGVEITQLVSENVKPLVDAFFVNVKEMGIIEESQLPLIQKQVLFFLVWSIPAQMAGSVLFETWLCLMAAKPVFYFKKVNYPDFGDLRKWKAPDYLVWAAIGSAALLLLTDGLLIVLGMSIMIILYKIYFFQGIAIVSYYLNKREISPGWRILIFGMIIFYPIAPLIASVFGFFDIWANFRKMETVMVSDED